MQLSIETGNVRLTGLQGEIDRINREIQSLGAVNLAALDELSAARERKGFLDSQVADLTEAMTTLEDAIKKIDVETRELLSSTFEVVNGHFGKMFPELFGGGNARLVMTGEEILDAGVQVMAQPPGKKNQRYAKLVASMSKSTQFLFISHNKIAMEMAEQLIGVTMQEQGVSRIVAVDMEAALGFSDTLTA